MRLVKPAPLQSGWQVVYLFLHFVHCYGDPIIELNSCESTIIGEINPSNVTILVSTFLRKYFFSHKLIWIVRTDMFQIGYVTELSYLLDHFMPLD